MFLQISLKKILNQWKYTKVEEIIIKEDPL